MRHLAFILSGVMLLCFFNIASASDYETTRTSLLEQEAAIMKNRKLSEDERFDQLVELQYEYTMNEFPTFATYIGYPKGHDRWSDQSKEAIERREEDQLRAFKNVKKIKRDKLSAANQLNYDLLVDDMKRDIEALRFPGELLAINQMGGVQQNVARTLTMMPRGKAEDWENRLARLEAVATLVDQNIALLKEGLAKGITPAKKTLRDVPKQIESLLTEEPMESPLLASFKGSPENDSGGLSYSERAAKIFTDSTAPAFDRLLNFMVDEYIPGATKNIARSSLPDGEAWYAYNVRRMTTTDLSPKEIHEIGLSEVKRIRSEMLKIVNDLGFDGDFDAFFEHLRTDPDFYFDEPEDLITAYRDISKRADETLPKVIGKLPRLTYGVQPIPSYAEKSQTTAYYQPGASSVGRAGIFFANTYDLKSRPKWEMEALTLHEAVPGHHLQLALQEEMENMPWFRKYARVTAYVEGWGLYSESLGPEMGFYTDPYSQFGQLTYEMWRAIRLVVDTGMHSLGWSREQAIEFFKENAGKAEHDIVVEIDRYIVWPGQALAYKIGELKIKELRKRAETALGDSFDVRAFHDVVLGSGAVPLNVLEKNVDRWLAEQS